MKNRVLMTILVSGSVAGCQLQSMPYYDSGQGYAQSYQPAPSTQAPVVPQAQPVRQAATNIPYPMIPQQTVPAHIAQEMNRLKERVRRVERAVIRMDRRMQLIERNELSRMSSGHLKGENTPAAQGMFQPMSFAPNGVEPAAGPVRSTGGYATRTMPFQQKPAPVFQPVSAPMAQPQQQNSGMITSSLQVAPKRVAYASQGQQKSGLAALPSLADKSNTQPQNDDVSIWTIRYDNDKVWPDHGELKSSHTLVQALRGEAPVALFARGTNPASRQFRERVRAVSKYLAKVSNLENVPIASMPAKHLDEDTIEILATK